MKKDIAKNFHFVIKCVVVFAVVLLVMSGCSSHKTVTKLGDAIIYENDSVTTKAEFPGGSKEFKSYKQIGYRTERKDNIGNQHGEGLGIYSFVIDQEGNVKNVKVLQAVAPSIDLTVTRLLKKMPKWKPATLNGEPVCVRVKDYWNFLDTRGEKVKYDIAPYFPGGTEALQTHLTTRYEGYYGVKTGVVKVSVIIDEEGNVVEPDIISGVGFYADREALSLVRSLPKWKPAMKNGKPIRVRRTLFVYFEDF